MAKLERDRDHWQLRVVAATGGNQTKLGAIILAAMGKRPPSLRRMFGKSATITSNGHVICNFRDSNGRDHMSAYVCSAGELRDNLRGLADHLKLSDKDRIALFDMVRKWIGTDYSDGKTLGKPGGNFA